MNLTFNEVHHLSKQHYKLLLDADPSKSLVDSYTKRGLIYDVTLEKQIVGIIVLLPTRPETLEVVNIAVDETFQKRGIGQKLLMFAINYSRHHHYKTLEIGTGSTSIGQLYLYQKVGFRLTGIDTDFFIHHYEKEITENGLVLRDMVRLKMEL